MWRQAGMAQSRLFISAPWHFTPGNQLSWGPVLCSDVTHLSMWQPKSSRPFQVSLGVSSSPLKTTVLEVWNQAGSQPTNVQTATLCPSFISALHHLLVLACPGHSAWNFLNLSIMKSHLLNKAFCDYPSFKPNVEQDTVFSGLPETFQQAVDTDM